MKIKTVKTSSVIPYEHNPRKNEHAVAKVAASIDAFGFQQPIVVDKDMVIIVGHTRHAAAIYLGIDKVPITVADKLTKAQVKQYRLADNRVHEESEWNEELLIQELEALQGAGADLDATGFDPDELERLLAEEGDEELKPQIIFSEELMESNNYVVLVFRNDVDWLAAQTHFDLQTRYSKRQNGKPWSAGIGRVVDGAKYLDRMNKEFQIHEEDEKPKRSKRRAQ